MTNEEKKRIKKMLDYAVKSYKEMSNREDVFDKPCIKIEAAARQSAAFNLADMLYQHGFITFEECCEVWAKVGFIDSTENCPYKKCSANKKGKCQYRLKEDNNAQQNKAIT